MKLILFSGTHSRHVFINSEALKHCDEALCIVMQREEVMPTPPKGISDRDKDLFIKHFENRKKVEDEVYKNLDSRQYAENHKTIFIQPHELNTPEMAKIVEDFDADMAFIFGVDMILSPVIEKLPKDKVNMHLGLSPWYKGGATLFWPFYFLQPQFAGTTFHQITEKPDAGELIHQCVPELAAGDTIHDVGAKCVIKARDDIAALFDHWKKHKGFKGKLQTTTGRVWRSVDFHASHLRVIYEQFNDDIVDAYLSGQLDQKSPKLFSCLTSGSDT